MDRRKFIKIGTTGTLVAGTVIEAFSNRNAQDSPVFQEPAKAIPLAGSYDVIVSGAGPAGVAAAIAAGRNGARVLLIEVQGCLGGVWTAGLLTWILDQQNKPGIMRELENRLVGMGAKSPIATGHRLAYDVEKMKLLLDSMCLDANVDVLLHTRVVAAAKESNNRISHIITESKSGREAWAGKLFIDASGDGDLAALAGCSFDFGSGVAGGFQPLSMLGFITGVRFEDIKPFVRWAGDGDSSSKKRLLEQIVKGGVLPSYTLPTIFPIDSDLFMIMANHEYGLSGLSAKDVTKGTINARRELHAIVDGLKSLDGAWKNVKLITTAEQIGIREGRRIHGLYTVTTSDLESGARHDDAICRVTFGVDVHSVSKADELDGKSYSQGIKAKPYDIPIRALIAKDVGGLLMAGRCISGDFIAHSSYRVTGNAVAMGEAAGKLAAKAAQQNILPQDVPFRSLDIQL